MTHSKAGQSIVVTIHYKLSLFEVGDNRTAWTLYRCHVFLVYLTYFPRGEISISELQFLGQSPAQIIWCNDYYYFHYYFFFYHSLVKHPRHFEVSATGFLSHIKRVKAV